MQCSDLVMVCNDWVMICSGLVMISMTGLCRVVMRDYVKELGDFQST